VILSLGARLLQAIAALVAFRAARGRPARRPVARLLAAAALADAARWWIAGALPAIGPYRGAARALYHLEQALFLLWPAGVAAVALRIFARRAPGPIAAAHAIVLAALVAGYPALRGRPLGWIYAGVHLAALVAACAALAVWLRRREPPRLEHVSALFVIALDAVLFLGPYFPPELDPFGAWGLAQIVYAALYLILIAVFATGVPWGRPTSSLASDSPPYLH
jgi:hypothetical protein